MGPINESGQSKLSVLIGPECSEGFVLVHLRHPKSKEAALFSFKNYPDSKEVREIISINQDFGAWFIDDVIENDGRAFLSTPVDPLLLALPYLRSAKRPVPLDHLLLEDEKEFPEAANRLAEVLIAKGLSPIANAKGSADLNVWQFDEKKSLAYLENKVKRVAKQLAIMRTDKSSELPNDDDIRKSWSILSDYLEPEVSALLGQHLEIKDEPVKKPEAASKPITLTGSRSLPSGPKEGARPLEDYSEDLCPKAKQPKLSTASSTKQKALAKSASGSKNIMSFFAKK